MDRALLIAVVLLGCSKRNESKVTEQAPPPMTVDAGVAMPTTGVTEDMVLLPAGEHLGHQPACFDGTAVERNDPQELTANGGKLRSGAFAIDRAEVRCSDYEQCVQRGVCHGSMRCDDSIAVVEASSAREYCAFRGAMLPRYRQWQRAIRGKGGIARAHDCSPSKVGCTYTSSDGISVRLQLPRGREWMREYDCYVLPSKPTRSWTLTAKTNETLLNSHMADDRTASFRCVRELNDE